MLISKVLCLAAKSHTEGFQRVCKHISGKPIRNTSVLQTRETVVTEKFLPEVLFISFIFPTAVIYVCWTSFQGTVNMLFLFVCHRMLVFINYAFPIITDWKSFCSFFFTSMCARPLNIP